MDENDRLFIELLTVRIAETIVKTYKEIREEKSKKDDNKENDKTVPLEVDKRTL